MTRFGRSSSAVSALAIAGAFAASLLAGVSSAQADIIFTPGNHPQPDETNIFFVAPETGGTITGQIGQPVGPAVNFESLTGQTLHQNAKGQASIENNDGGQLTSIGVTVPGLLFADFIMNLQGLDGTAHIDVRDNNDDISQFDLPAGPGNGSNFLTITISPDQFAAGVRIAGVFVNAADGFDVFKQPRISGVCNPGIEGCGLVPITEAPEPASLALLGGALLGFGVLRRRKRT
jgi:PEP-CTERM motif-containing protein